MHFGVFELDVAARELRKRGVRIKLQDQPFRVLEALLEKPGEIVTREELKDRLWAQDEFVEFDKSLNTAVQKIRQALDDSANSPRFVETVPKAGYRFVAPVRLARSTEPSGPTSFRLRRLGVAALAVACVGAWWWVARPARPAFELPSYSLKQITRDDGLTFQPALSRDGSLIAYASDRSGEGNLDIWVQQVAGGEPIRLTRHDLDDSEPHFSPDSSKVVFRSERDGGGVYVVSALGGTPTLIARKGRRPRFSPDGALVAYWVGDEHGPGGTGHTVPSSGGEPSQLPHGRAPVWLGDEGRLIAVWQAQGGEPDAGNPHVIADEDGTRDWWVLPSGAEGPVKTGVATSFEKLGLAPPLNRPVLGPGAWNPLLGGIVFAAKQGDTTNLWFVSASDNNSSVTGPPRRLSAGTEVETYPSVDARGRIAFSGIRQNLDVWALPIDGDLGTVRGELERLTDNLASDSHPDVSAAGTMLVFETTRGGNSDVWIKDLISGRERPLASSSLDERNAVISADGSVAAYTARSPPAKPEVFTIPTAGGLAESVCGACGVPTDWNSPADWILTNPGGLYVRMEHPETAWIAMLDPASGQEHPLLRSEWALYDGRISPNGRWVVFHMKTGPSTRQLFVAPIERGRVTERTRWIEATAGSGNDFHPAWSPSGNLLYFLSDRDGFRCIWAQRLHPETTTPQGSAFEVYHSGDVGYPLDSGDPKM